MQKKLLILLPVFLFICLLTVSGCEYFQKKDDSIHIALVGPMTGKHDTVGKSFRQGVKLYIDSINDSGGINGRQVVIDIYDDQNNQELARSEALKIVQNNKALAVIGHHYSTCSIKGGDVYKKEGIPAISPASTNVNVTLNNPWFFRSSFNDNLQGRFLANYAKKVFNKPSVSIIYEQEDYGTYLADIFEKTSIELGTEIKYKWQFDPYDRQLDSNLKQIVYDLKSKDDAGVVFISTHADAGIKILKTMKDAVVLNPVMGPDAFASEAFQKGFDIYPKERRNPGFYTNGMYVTTPLIFDTTNSKGQKFKESYIKEFREIPGWHAAFAYDTAMVIVHALKSIEAQGLPDTLKEERRKLRNFLASMNTIDDAVEGVTGYNYFDKWGDSQKPVLIGVYKNKNIVSALTQFQTITNPAALSQLEAARKQDKVLMFDGHYMYRINVIYTGIDIIEIDDINFKDLTCTLDFFMWFRYQGEMDTKEMLFLNAAEPVTMGQPIREKITKDNLNYKLYRIKGRFRMDFIPSQYVYGEHIAGVSIRHPAFDRNNLVYVKDVLGMGSINDEEILRDKMQDSQVISPAVDWKIKRVWFFQDILEEHSMGNPEYLNITGGNVEYSRFNMAVRLAPDKFILRHIIPEEWIVYMLILSIVMFLFFLITAHTKRFGPYIRVLWVLQFISAMLLLISGEYYSINKLGGTYYLEPVVLTFKLLWWIIPTIFINICIKRFIWAPLEERTKRSIPKVLQNASVLIIYVMSFFGIIAFVFDQPLTSLLASTGVAAMIFGLALQVNISNIFSGIAINLERPFRVGDWVKIDDFKEGKVIDINWRSTRIKTRDDTIVCIPNSQASESPIENFSYPDDGYYKYFTVHIDPVHPPERVKKILMDAVLSTPGLESDPAPGIRFLGLTAGMTGQSESWAANYLISVYAKDYGKKFAHNEMVWSNVWIHLNRAGIRHVMPRQETHMFLERIKKKQVIPDKAYGILQEIEMFQPFSHEAKIYLSQHMKRHHFYPGESIVRQGDTGNSLFIIEEGVVGVRVKFDNRQSAVEVAKMGAGNFFGEMALLTGEQRTATIISVTETYLYEITKENIAPLIEDEPRISRLLSNILTERKMGIEAKKHADEAEEIDKATLASQLFNKIQNFFGFKH
ncbi:Leucine and cyclic nucleotide binding domain-containing protein [Desulfonema limicola]|uniref:Leucine and cyclic nucleotide binding domain-containing protein n=1 Tax=Desulfonema limicola TaxID=45656 RepID=A0A975GKL6_9BACT|nr:ABC transporter substrate-binding protein [Desulfonema limicola]QTA83923.1 Leucine and cyclic nucleotide binding domain-containing protein [Desulfonema limicola]